MHNSHGAYRRPLTRLSICFVLVENLGKMSIFKYLCFVIVSSLAWNTFGTCHASGPANPVRPGSYQIESEWHLGGAGGWGKLLLDPGANQLFIPRSDRIDVVDTASGKVSGHVTGFIGAHDIALSDNGKLGYVSDLTDGSAGFVRVFDRTTFQILKSIPVGRTPDQIAMDALTNTVLVLDGSAHDATIIDSSTNQVVETIALPARPGSVVADGRGYLFVAIRSLNEIIRIDASMRKITATWPLAPCEGPSGLTMDKARQQIFAACENQKLVIINASNGATSTIAEIPKGVGNISYDAGRQLIFVSNGAGTLTIFQKASLNRFVKLQELTTLPGAQALTVSATNGAAYLATAKYGQRTGDTSEELRYRPTPINGSFTILVVTSRARPYSSVRSAK
jgi:DNA-binding beta-propeller fold protein YncE